MVENNTFYCRAEMEMQVSIIPVLAIFNELDLMCNWVRMIDFIRALDEPTLFRRLIQFRFKAPWPVKDREAILQGIGIPFKEDQSAIIMMKSYNKDNFLGIPIPECEEGVVRVDVDIGFLHVRFIDA